MTNSKAKPATHPWRKHGDGEITPSDQHGVFVRTLTAAEYQHFKDTKELPKVGNVSVVKDNPFGRLIWRPGLEWIAENVRDRRIAQRVEQIEGEARPRLAAASIADEWVQTNGYTVHETARDKLAKEIGEKEANARLDRVWLSWAVRQRAHDKQTKQRRHSRGRRKEDRTQTLVNQARNPDTLAVQTQRTVEALNHDALTFGHDLRFGHWHPGPFRDQILVWELREGAVMDAVFGRRSEDDLVVAVLGELYDDAMFNPEVAKEMNAARALEQEAMIGHLEGKETDILLDRAKDHRAAAAEIRHKLGQRERPQTVRDAYD
jgi:hypothetical protein